MRQSSNEQRSKRSLSAMMLLLTAISLPFAGCSDLLAVKDVDVTAQANFVDATSIPALRASVLADFQSAFENQILYSGLLGDEWVHSGTYPTRLEVDRREIDVNNATTEGLFSGLSRARAMADFVNDRYDAVDPDNTAMSQRAEARALSGMALLLLAEHYCEGTPISRFVQSDNDFIYGPPLTRAQVLDTAMARFDGALAAAPSGSDAAYLAAIGKARTYLNMGASYYDDAAAAVAAVPTDWLFRIDHNAQSGQNNSIWSYNTSQERWSATDGEGGNGLHFLTEDDPRVLAIRTPSNDVGFDRRTPVYNALKYSDRPAWTVVADGVEARLIEAEDQLYNNQDATFLVTLNDLRTQVATLLPLHYFDFQTQLSSVGVPLSLAPLTAPATHAESVDLLFHERGFWLWLTAHRLGDMRRLIRQYGRDTETVFPTGLYIRNGYAAGGSYGPDVNFPIPVPEQNNPQPGAGVCLNRDP